MPLNEKQSESKKRPGTWSMNWSNSIQGRKKKLKTDHHYAQKASELNADADTLSPLATGSTAGAGGQVEETVLSEKTKPRDSGYNPSKSQKMYNLAMKSELLKRGKSLSVSPSRPLHSARYTPSSPHRTIAQAFLSPRRSRVQTKCTSSSITASPNGDQKNTAEYRRSLPRVAKGSPLRSTSLVAKNYKHVKPSYTSEYAYYNSQIKVVVDTDGKEEQLERNDSTGSTSYAMNDGTSSRTLRALKRARSPDFSFEIKKELVEVAVSELGTAEKYNGNEGRQDNQSEEEEKNTSFSLENNSNSSFRADSPIYELKSKSKREGDAKERCINSDLVDVIESVKRDDGIIVDAEEHIVLQNDRQELNTPCSGALERQLPSCGILDYASPLTELSDEPSEDSQELKNDSSRSRAIDDPVSSGTVPPVQDDLLSLVHPSTPKREGADDLSNRRDRLVSSEPCAYNALLASSLLGIKAAACALRTLAVQNENREMDLELYTNNLDQNDMRDKEGSPSSISSRHHSRSLSTSTSPTSVDEHQTEAEIEVGEDESKSCQNDQIGDEPVPDPTMKVPTVQIDSPSNGGLIDSTFDDVREAIDHAISKAAPRASKSNSSGFLHPRSAPAPVSRTTQAVLSSKIEAGLSTTAEYDENEEDLADSLFRINMPSPRMISASLPGNTPPNRSSSSSNTNVQHSGLERSDSVESVLWSRSTALQAENAILKFRGKECCLIPEREDLTQTKLSYHNYNSSLDVSLIKQSIGNNKNSFEVHPPTPEKWKEYERLTPDDYVNYDLPLLSKMTFSTSLISSAGVIADYGNRYMEPILSVYREGGISVIEESPTASPSDMVFSP